MIFAPVSNAEMQAARLLSGVAMVGFLGAPLFRHRAQQIRLFILIPYVTGMAAFIAYHIW